MNHIATLHRLVQESPEVGCRGQWLHMNHTHMNVMRWTSDGTVFTAVKTPLGSTSAVIWSDHSGTDDVMCLLRHLPGIAQNVVNIVESTFEALMEAFANAHGHTLTTTDGVAAMQSSIAHGTFEEREHGRVHTGASEN